MALWLGDDLGLRWVKSCSKFKAYLTRASTLTWLENPPFAIDIQYIHLSFFLHAVRYWKSQLTKSTQVVSVGTPLTWSFQTFFSVWPLFQMKLACVLVWFCGDCRPTFLNAMEIKWVLKMDFFSTNVEEILSKSGLLVTYMCCKVDDERIWKVALVERSHRGEA